MSSDQFNYKYSAPTEEERIEIASIRRQYVPNEHAETKIERLRKLDSFVKNAANVASLVLGIAGCLMFGLGLAMILEWSILLWGIILCIIGGATMVIAYPVYKAVLNKNKQKYGDEILKLSEELLGENSKTE